MKRLCMITPSPLSRERERERERERQRQRQRESHTAVCLYITTVYDNTVAAEYREREPYRCLSLYNDCV